MSVSDRHEGDLGGKLRPFGEATAGTVVVRVAPEWAAAAATQHTLWMLVNLLCRLAGVVDEVVLDVPDGIALRSNVIPLAPDSTDLLGGVLAGAKAIGIVPVRCERGSTPTIAIGPGEPVDGALRCYGEGWQGGISRLDVAPLPEAELPIGPYIAACIAAGEIFCGALYERYEPTTSAWYCAWSHRGGGSQRGPGPDMVDVELAHALIGIGAVGSTVVHSLWATPNSHGSVALVDGDENGVEDTNLNRYPLFGHEHIGAPKATQARRVAANCGITWTPYDLPIEQLNQDILGTDRIVSAVDLNRARRVIQSRYPSELLSGSTLDLRAEILRCGPPGDGACLGCFNPPERAATDDELRKRLAALDQDQRAKLAHETDQSVDELDEWVTTGRCGQGTPLLLAQLRDGEELPENFAVGFVSVMSGTLLAAELLKEGLRAPALANDSQRASFQFFNPASERNGASFLGRHPACAQCRPGEVATEIWLKRWRMP
jgi:hypothetical protein